MAVSTGLSFAKLLYRPIFDRLAVSARLVIATGDYAVSALDKTLGVSLPQNSVILETMTPLAELMMADVQALGISLNDLGDGQITLFPPGSDTSDLANGKTWNIIAYRLNPSNSGIADGTVFLELEGNADD